jgi:hypothetical protein
MIKEEIKIIDVEVVEDEEETTKILRTTTIITGRQMDIIMRMHNNSNPVKPAIKKIREIVHL